MNKKLLAVAVGAALTGAPMLANAAATVYGNVHLSVDNVRAGGVNGGIADNQAIYMASNSSFFGFKAEDDIGGGMKGIAGAEWQMAFDTGATGATIANRDVFVGLQGGFGTLRLGNMDDIVKNVGRKVDFFHSTQIGESRSITAFNGMDRRIANGVRYDSPKLGPVTLNGHYGLATNADQDNFNDFTTWSAGAVVTMGGLYLGMTHRSQEAAGAVANTKETQRGTRVAASYGFGFGLTLAGLYQTFQNPNTPNAAAGSAKTYGGGASMKVGNGVIKAQYYKVDHTQDFNTRGSTLAAAGYDHNLSKNTMVYAVYGAVRNQSAATATIIGAGHNNSTPDDTLPAAGTGGHNNALSVGMRVIF